MRHYIFLANSFSRGSRIAYDIIVENEERTEQVSGLRARIKEECGTNSCVALHSIVCSHNDWESVQKENPFFRNVELFTDVDEFVKILKNEQELRAIDVAAYILSKQECTQLRLHKLLYLCYAEYLCKTGKKLFKSPIKAFKLGPVIAEIYDRFAGKYDLTMEDIKGETKARLMPSFKEFLYSTRSRIIYCSDGWEKFQIIDEVLEKYKDTSTRTLVDITHRDNSPWAITKENNSKIITDDIIMKHHYVEQK